MTVGALVLAGGRGRRLGRRKPTAALAGRSLLERAVARAAEVCDEVLISGPPTLSLPGVPAVPDEFPDFGPLAGIMAGLMAARSDALIVIPCDSPFVPANFLRGLAGLAGRADVVIPRAGEQWEPLHGLYSRVCADPIRRLLAAGERRIIRLYDQVSVHAVGPEEYGAWDPQGLAFFNINTEDDLRRAEELISGGAG